MRVGSIAVALTSQGFALARDARADGSACRGTRVQEAADVPADWAASIRKLRRELAPPDSDATCAAITLSLEAASQQTLRLTAMTWDGRSAEREVLRPSALVATAVGLVASIPEEAPAEPPPVRDTPPEPKTPEGRPDEPLPPRASPPERLPSAKPVALSLAGALGARVTGSTFLELIDLDGRFDAILRARWVFSASLRYAPTVGPHPDDTEFDELVAGVGVGRRIPFGASTLDLSVAPALAVMMMKWHADLPDARSGSTAAFRLGLSARWSTPLGGSWRFAVTADVDANPWAFQHDPSLGANAPALPVWTSGLCVGGIGELL